MLSKVEDSMLDRISISESEIILNGPPDRLVGNVVLQNGNDATMKIRSLALEAGKGSKSKLAFNPNLRVNTKLAAGEQRLEHVNLSLARDTPPGTYEKYLLIGGKKRKVKMIVQPTIEISVNPSEFTFQNSAPGTVQSAIFTVTNLGNLPFQIPNIKHVAALDMDYLCRAFGAAFRTNGNEGLTATLDSVTQNIKENLTNWANANVEESGAILQPGQSKVVHLNITLPKNANADTDYNGSVRFWDKDLSFVIKSHVESSKSRKDAK